MKDTPKKIQKECKKHGLCTFSLTNKGKTKSGKIRYSYRCDKCTNEKRTQRSKILKEKCVQYKGGCCIICGYNRDYTALEFHHIDSSQKDFNISRYKSMKFSDKLKEELDKCILVCANCHREIHSGTIKLEDFDFIPLI